MRKGILITEIIVIIALIVTGVFVYFPFDIFGEFEEHIELGVQHINNGEYQEAILEFDRAIEINDKVAEVYIVKASAQVIIGDESSAKETVAKGLSMMHDGTAETHKATALLEPVLNGETELKSDKDVLMWWCIATEGDAKYDGLREFTENYLEESSTLPPEEQAKIKQKYIEFLSTYPNNYLYQIYDIDQDGVPELFLYEDSYTSKCDIYTYTDSSVEKLWLDCSEFDDYSYGYSYELCSYHEGVGVMRFGYVPYNEGESYDEREFADIIIKTGSTLTAKRIHEQVKPLEMGNIPIGLSYPSEIAEGSEYLIKYYCEDDSGLQLWFNRYDDIYTAYKDALTWSGYDEGYALYDIDKDGVPELLKADYDFRFDEQDVDSGLNAQVFTYQDGKFINLGYVFSFNSVLYEFEKHGIIYAANWFSSVDNPWLEVGYIKDKAIYTDCYSEINWQKYSPDDGTDYSFENRPDSTDNLTSITFTNPMVLDRLDILK